MGSQRIDRISHTRLLQPKELNEATFQPKYPLHGMGDSNMDDAALLRLGEHARYGGARKKKSIGDL